MRIHGRRVGDLGLTLSALFVPVPLTAQVGGGPTGALRPADTAVAVLPVPTRPLSALAFVERLPVLTRGEYETTTAYRARVAAAVPDGLTLLDVPSVPASAASRAAGPCGGTVVSYDADRGALTIALAAASLDVTASGHEAPQDFGRFLHAVVVSCRAAAAGRYTGSNAFGVRARVQRQTVSRVAVTTAGLWHDDVYAPWAVPMSPADAQTLRPRLHLGLLVRPQPGPTGWAVETVEERDGATLDDPRDVRTRTLLLWAAPAVLVAYDSQTGRVLARRALALHDSADVAEAAATKATSARGGTGSNDVYFDYQVEVPATLVPGTLTLPHVTVPGAAGGRVTAQVVVGTDGRPDMATWKVLDSSGDAFSHAARDAAERAHFTPARVAGRPVRQLVQLPFAFAS